MATTAGTVRNRGDSGAVEGSSFDAHVSELNSLVMRARLCKLATKTAGCCCLPLTWICNIGCFVSYCFPEIFMSEDQKKLRMLPADACCEGIEEEPESHKKYSNWSSFDGGNSSYESLSRRPPKVCLDQIQYVFDPLVCLFCYTKGETSQHYLSRDSQVQMIKLVKALRNYPQGNDQFGPEKQLIDERPFTINVSQMMD